MYQVRLPISLLKLVYGLAVVTENGSWATKHTAWVAEQTAWVAENVSYYAKAGAEKIKSANEWIEQKARETKIEYQQAIRKEEFIQINKDIAESSEKYNPQLVERTETELADWVILEKE